MTAATGSIQESPEASHLGANEISPPAPCWGLKLTWPEPAASQMFKTPAPLLSYGSALTEVALGLDGMYPIGFPS